LKVPFNNAITTLVNYLIAACLVSPSTQEPQIIKAMMLEELTRMNEEYDRTLQYIQQQIQVERAMITKWV